MSLYYFDTSALIKRYHVEAGTEKVDQIFAESEESFIISNITISEITSALVKKRNEGIISEDDLKLCLSQFYRDLLTDFWIIDLERYHIYISKELILKYNLRTLDALHLASLLSLKNQKPILVCSDKKLLEASKYEGISVVNPETD